MQFLHLESRMDGIAGWVSTTGIVLTGWILVGLVISFLVSKLVRPTLFFRGQIGVSFESYESQKRVHTLVSVVRGALTLFIWLTVLFFVLKAVGFSFTTLLASASILGVAVGLGAQSLVKDVIAGFFILTENHFNISDVVDIAGVSGKVEEINLRTTVLRDLKGAMHVVPNGQITVVTNRTREWAQVVLDIAISPEQDIDEAIAVIKQVGAEMMEVKSFQNAVLSPPRMLGVDEISKSAIMIRSLIKTSPAKQWAVERVMRKKVKQAFDKAGIKMAK
jgi:moderate conductance mechanosensitive channel